jgi:NitT/TauT family transport system permease protein
MDLALVRSAHAPPLPPPVVAGGGSAPAPVDSRAITDTQGQRKGRWRTRLRYAGVSALWFVLAWGTLLGAWELASLAGWLNPGILPPPSETLPYALSGEVRIGFGQQRMGLTEAVLVTLGRVGLGMGGGLLAALVLSIGIIEVRVLRRLALPIVQAVAPIAPVAWIPFTIVLVGIGAPAAVFIVFMAVFGTLTLSFVSAFENIAPEFIAIAHNLRTSRLRLWWFVRFPAILPGAVTALRMAFFGAWMAALAGEMAGINSGLGYMIVMAQQMFNMKVVMIGILAIGVIGFTVDRLLLMLNRVLTGSMEGERGDGRRSR